MIDFVNILELNNQIYESNGNLGEVSLRGKFLFTMKEFVSFGTDIQSMLFMTNILLKEKIDYICVTQFKISYIHYKYLPSHKHLFHYDHYMWRGDQDL